MPGEKALPGSQGQGELRCLFPVHWMGRKVLPVVPHPCPLRLSWSCSLGDVLGTGRAAASSRGVKLLLGSASLAQSFTFGRAGPVPRELFPSPLARGHQGSPATAPPPGAGPEDLTRLQMEESGLREELATHPDGDKSERCQSHLQWKTTKWLVGRQLVDEGAGNCFCLLSPPPCIKTCSALLPSALPGSTVSTRAGLFHGLHLAFSAYLVL